MFVLFLIWSVRSYQRPLKYMYWEAAPYAPKGPHRNADRHWEQLPPTPRPDRVSDITFQGKGHGRNLAAEQERTNQIFAPPPIEPRILQDTGHKFFKQDPDGNWHKQPTQFAKVPQEKIQKIRKSNESSAEMVLAKPAAQYVGPGEEYGQAVPLDQLSRAPGAIPDRRLDPNIHQKGSARLRQRRFIPSSCRLS